MHKLRIILLIVGFLTCVDSVAQTPENAFWSWFEKNQEMLFNFENDVESTFDKLSEQMKKINPDLTFEFGPIRPDGKREFVISAGGIRAAFPSVESLYDNAPNLNKWIFVKFRPRRDSLNNIEYGGISVKANEVHYKLFRDDKKLGVILFFKSYSKEKHDLYGGIGYLFLDQALGEYDVETKLGFIEFHGRDSKYYDGAKPLVEMRQVFDNYFENKE